MTNIKVGDTIIRQSAFRHGLFRKRIKEIHNKTISVVDTHINEDITVETGLEPKQHPDNYRIYQPEIITKMKEVGNQIEMLDKQFVELWNSLPKIEL